MTNDVIKRNANLFKLRHQDKLWFFIDFDISILGNVVFSVVFNIHAAQVWKVSYDPEQNGLQPTICHVIGPVGVELC